MAVPNTNIFTMRDVVTEIYNDNRNTFLSNLFTDAIGIFDSNYVGNKDRLSNFRNYQHETLKTYMYLSGLGITTNTGITYTCTWRISAHLQIADYGIGVTSSNDTNYFIEKYYQAGIFSNSREEVTLPNLNVGMYPPLISGKTYTFSPCIRYNSKVYYLIMSQVPTLICP